MKSQQRGDHKNQGKSKGGKGNKGKGKKILEDERPTKPVQKLWYEALSPEGYTYYWNVETNGESMYYVFEVFLSSVICPRLSLICIIHACCVHFARQSPFGIRQRRDT